MKKKVKAQIINGDWEIKKYKIKKEVKEFVKGSKDVLIITGKCFAIGVGIGTVILINSNL